MHVTLAFFPQTSLTGVQPWVVISVTTSECLIACLNMAGVLFLKKTHWIDLWF